jgi:hypothetical protein
MLADVDLPWFFGTGPSTAQGDTGLRSSLGGQLSALQSGITQQPTVDSSRAEDGMIRQLGAAHHLGQVTARLRQLSERQVLVLRLHYGTPSIVAGLSGCAVLCPEAADLVHGPVSRESIAVAGRAALRARETVAWVALELAATRLWTDAARAYSEVELARSRKVWAE